jgi:peptidoglycan/LPS O-acetylase OafA/YrhL
LMIYKSTDYLQQNIGSLSPFQHFWSLSVEEQYYIFWPLLVWLVLWVSAQSSAKRRARAGVQVIVASAKKKSWMAAGMLAIIIALSLWASIVLTDIDAPLAYFSTFTRAWEFAGGALLAIVVDQRLIKVAEPKQRHWIWFMLGVLMTVSSIFLFDHNTPFPSFWAAIPTVGAMLMIYGGQSVHRFVPRKSIEWRPVQFIGDISYSFYLWHWPLIILVPIWYGKDIGNFWTLVVFLAAIGLGYLSKRFVEDPVRFGWLARRSNGWQLALTFTAIAAVLITNSSIGYRASDVLKHSFASQSFKPALTEVANDVSAVDKQSCSVAKDEDAFRTCDFGDLKGTVRVALLGDSHMRQYFAPLEVMAQHYHWRLTLISKSACPPLSDTLIPANVTSKTCVTWQTGLAKYLASQQPFDLIIESSSSLVSAKLEHVQTSFARLVSSQIARGSKWLVIRDNPKPKATFLACIEKNQQTAADACAVSRGWALQPFDRLSLSVQGLPGVTIADFTRIYCQLKCSPVINNIIVYRDHSHLTNTFVETLRPAFEAVVPREFLK